MYWFGALESGQLFRQYLVEQGWQLPMTFSAIENIDDLDQVIDRFHHYPQQQNARLLCAGVHCSPPSDKSGVVGEAGFAWIAGHAGKVISGRPERQDKADETPVRLAEHVMKSAAMKDMPEHCLALQKSVAEELQQSGWPTLDHILEVFWGELQGISPFVAMSIAVFQSRENQQPCGWLAQDAQRKSIIGVITIDKEQ
ncbi:hypothetical protein ACQ86O_15480 [Serratia sp. L9]|uniref:hypothetical protein n=1 Tax=Serratia sp. L9 TaxID=3423946 RepID=UPI003D66AB14